jgi:DNA polymerase I
MTRNYGLISSLEELSKFFERLGNSDESIGFDLESGYLGPDKEKYSLHPETAILVGFSFTNSTDWARYVPLRHDTGENLDSREVARLVWPLAQSGRFVIHNAPFELRHMSRWFRDLLGDDPEYGDAVRAANGYFPFRSCTQVESYLAAEHQSFALKSLVKEIFNHQMIELHELFGEDLKINKRKFLRFNVLDPHDPKVIEYACEDALWALALHYHYHDKVKERLLYKVDIAILDNVCEMEDVGVRYDWALMRRTAEELTVFRDRFNAEIMTRLSEMVGEPVAINLSSPKQVGEILYGQLGMKTSVFTAASKDKPPAERKMSTGAIALAGLAKKHPVVKQILQWKEQTRLLGTYLEKYEEAYGYADDGHTHPNHISAVVVTGRFAVSDPPYQQSPRTYHYDLQEAIEAHAEDREPPPGTCFKFNFRDCIIAPPDHYILGFDYSQAELRAIAGEAQEIALLRAFESGEDVHRVTAALIFGVSVDQVTKEQRDVGKTITFALQYGMKPQGLADRLGISEDEAEALYEKYFSAFSSIATWNERQIAQAKASGHVMSKFGRVLPIWEYQSDKHWIRNKGDRAAVNYPIQGSATGDMPRIAMVRARKALRAAGLHDRVHLVMNIHDALQWYVHRSVSPQEVINILQPAVVFEVPGWPAMVAEWYIAKKWGSPVEVKLQPDGTCVIQGDRAVESRPAVEVDKETGEEVVDLPEVNPAALRAALQVDPQSVVGVAATETPQPEQVTYVEPSPDGRQVIITVPDMPDETSYRRFLDLLLQTPGPNKIILRTPEGDLELDIGTSITPAESSTVAMALAGATVTYAAADVDPAEVVAGLAL